MDAYIQRISAAVVARGGTCSLSSLSSVEKPAGKTKIKLKKTLEKHKDLFKLSGEDKKEWIVSIAGTPDDNMDNNKGADDYIQLLATAVTSQGGCCKISQLGGFVKIPTNIQSKLKPLLQSRPDLFTLSGEKVTCSTSRVCNETKAQETKIKPSASDTAPRDNAVDRGAAQSWCMTNGNRCVFIDKDEALKHVISMDPALCCADEEGLNMVAIDCEGVPDTLELIQVATTSAVYIFDCRTLGEAKVCEGLKPLLESKTHIKLMHDLHKDAVAMAARGQVSLSGVLDTQLVAEHMWGEMFVGFNLFLEKLELPLHPSKGLAKVKMSRNSGMWKQRPLPKADLEYAALDASLLLAAASSIQDLISEEDFNCLLGASQRRATNAIANDAVRTICFDVSKDFAMASAELLETTRPNSTFVGETLVVQSEVEDVLKLLPGYLRAKFDHTADGFVGHVQPMLNPEHGSHALSVDRLSEVILDIGRRPHCWVDDERIFLCDDESRVVEQKDVQHIADRLGEFGSDNRAGLDGKLHRFSAIRNRDGRIAGITARIGRSVLGNAALLMDLLLGSDLSILILGEPGSGKTTIVREATRKLAECRNVIVVDTSNEIAGDGLVPHSCIGLARRMMVPSLEQQSAIMVECVQNHTPHVMVIDEIGRPKEVNAARTVKQRGVRMIASAHGDLRKLLKNKELNGLVGGVESVVMGDAMARQEAQRKSKIREAGGETPSSVVPSKTKVQRGGEPTFEIVVEVRRGAFHEWRVVMDAAKAVDDILDGRQYKVQLRSRDPETGAMRVDLAHA